MGDNPLQMVGMISPSGVPDRLPCRVYNATADG
jgi:hypothetical protein